MRSGSLDIKALTNGTIAALLNILAIYFGSGRLKHFDPAGVVEGAIGEGSLNLLGDCQLAAAVACGPFKFTVTSPYMLARTLDDYHYHDFAAMTMAIADVLAAQLPGLPCDCIQIDEANIPGNPEDAPLAARAINRLLDQAEG